MTIKQVQILAFAVSAISCRSEASKDKFTHSYTNYWEKYSEQGLIDTLFSDTLLIDAKSEGSEAAKKFYINTTQQLLADLQDDRNNTDSLFPATVFDKLTIRKLPLGFEKTFSNEQTAAFLELINDPVSFDWRETTYAPAFKVKFYKQNKVVASLTIDSERSVINTEPSWPIFKKMKFGGLKTQSRDVVTKLLDSIGQ